MRLSQRIAKVFEELDLSEKKEYAIIRAEDVHFVCKKYDVKFETFMMIKAPTVKVV